MDDDWVKSNIIKESEGGGEGGKVVGYDGPTNFDDGELLLRDGGEVVEVLLSFSLGADLAEELDDS